jgi:hypothetical protein
VSRNSLKVKELRRIYHFYQLSRDKKSCLLLTLLYPLYYIIYNDVITDVAVIVAREGGVSDAFDVKTSKKSSNPPIELKLIAVVDFWRGKRYIR